MIEVPGKPEEGAEAPGVPDEADDSGLLPAQPTTGT